MKTPAAQSEFIINNKKLLFDAQLFTESGLIINSVPRAYRVEFRFGRDTGRGLQAEISASPSALVVIDKTILEMYFSDAEPTWRGRCFVVEAKESAKTIETVMEVVDFFVSCGTSKNSMVFAIGGGIIQDICAFAAYLYKRGIPWTFVPTTLLSQADSSVGGKTALNHKMTKNLLALFSAPRHIVIEPGFLSSLSDEDWLSGGGEIFRLCLTGGELAFSEFEKRLVDFLNRDLAATGELTAISLSIKKAVVEFDEFEIDIRRSMNYGHSFGHALEALTGYQISHGAAVTLGILVESEISFMRGGLPLPQRDRILAAGRKLLSAQTMNRFLECELDGILNLLSRDKKSEGNTLKIATLTHLGKMDFIDLRLDVSGEREIQAARASVVKLLSGSCDR